MTHIDEQTVRHTAHLARLAIEPSRIAPLAQELQKVLALINRMSAVDVSSVTLQSDTRTTPLRPDVARDGNIAADIVRNAPAPDGHFFTVPKVIE